MKSNVDKVLERDQKLSELDNRAGVLNINKFITCFLFIRNIIFLEALQAGASQFEASAGKLKRKFWLKNLKVDMCQYKVNVVDHCCNNV